MEKSMQTTSLKRFLGLFIFVLALVVRGPTTGPDF
jgi:hypothetical protein